MALTNKGTQVFINESYLPAGYTKPTVDKFTDFEAKYPDYEIQIAKAGVENADKVTTFTALVTAITAAVSAMITDDFNVGVLTVTCFANLKAVDHNFNLVGVLYSDGAVYYICNVDIFVKTAT